MTDAEFLEQLLASLPPGAKHVQMPPADYQRLYALANVPKYGASSSKARTRSVPRVRHLAEKAQQRMIDEVAEKLAPSRLGDVYRRFAAAYGGQLWTPDELARIKAMKPTLVFHDDIVFEDKTAEFKISGNVKITKP